MQQHALMSGNLHNEWKSKHEEAHGSKASAVGRLKQALGMLHDRALPVLLCSEVYPVYISISPLSPIRMDRKAKHAMSRLS